EITRTDEGFISRNVSSSASWRRFAIRDEDLCTSVRVPVGADLQSVTRTSARQFECFLLSDSGRKKCIENRFVAQNSLVCSRYNFLSPAGSKKSLELTRVDDI